MAEDSTEGNRAAALRLLEAVNRGDIEAIKAETADDFELHPLVSVWEGTYIGHDGIDAWRRDVAGLWDEFEIRADEVDDASGGAVIVSGRWRGRPRAASQALDGPIAAVVRFAAGKATSADVFHDRAQAVAEAESPD